jgi:hypothetical protein
MAGQPKRRARRLAQEAAQNAAQGIPPSLPVAPSGALGPPPKRGPGRPRKHPLPGLGTAPMQPPPLPPNPGPVNVETARDVDREQELAAQELKPAQPAGLDARGLVELVAEVRSIALSTYAMMQRARFEPGELEALCELAPSRRRSMEAFAPAALPWVNAHLPNAGGVGVGLFLVTALFSCVEPMREIKARAPKRDLHAPPPELDGDRSPTKPGESIVHERHAPVPSTNGIPDAWPELGTTRPASPGT